jgi:hypothetical protein
MCNDESRELEMNCAGMCEADARDELHRASNVLTAYYDIQAGPRCNLKPVLESPGLYEYRPTGMEGPAAAPTSTHPSGLQRLNV